jgi:glycosyltransferase involved in cell wall biosynthesis
MAAVALVHDYLTQRGGAERVVAAMARAFPEAPLYTALFDAGATHAALSDVAVQPLWLNTLPVLRRHHRWAFPLLAPTFSFTTIDAPVTLVSSSGWAHGVRVTGRKVVYCYAPARWLYQRKAYLGGHRRGASIALSVLGPTLKSWDRQAARSADRYMCVSAATQRLVRECYGIEGEILHPPAGLDASGAQTELAWVEPGFLLCVSRLVPYKNVGAVIAAAARLPGTRVVIAGDGPERERLQAEVGSNVAFTGKVSEAQLRWLYAHSAGVVAAGYEDFGLTVLEAAGFGRPVAALRAGGYLETVSEGRTGVFFDTLLPDAVAVALGELTQREWSPAVIKQWAARFGEAAFAARLHEVVVDEMARA